MPTTQGVVKAIHNKTVKGGKVVYSFTLYDDDNLYRTGFDKPQFSVDVDEVKFDYEQDRFGFQVDVDSILVRPGKPPVVSKGAKAASVGGKDSYWQEKDRYDKEVRQPIIMYQAATQVAKDLAIAALEAGILPTPGTKKQDKYENFLATVGEIRDDIYLEYEQAVCRLEKGVPIVDKEIETPEPTIDKEEVPVDETRWLDDLEDDSDWG